MDEREFKARTKAIALRVIKLIEALPSSRATDVIARQVVSMKVASIKTLRARNPKSKIQNLKCVQ